MTGFGVRVDGARKSYFWRAKVNGRVVFKALGEFPYLPLKDARNEAKRLAGLAAEWSVTDSRQAASAWPPMISHSKPGSSLGAITHSSFTS